MPGPYYYYWPGNPVIKPFGVAELLLSRLRRVWIPAYGENDGRRMRSRTFSLVCFGVSTRLCPLGSPLPIICHCRSILLLAGQSSGICRSA
ncbi:hypothetical protein [Candidatus Spongiihabitans sp.]|uniref:hypothetical protein n=1 Tax=Candidatus Spongiihabitans sp. TaxID=3101308 RepID=UPI003C7BCE86